MVYHHDFIYKEKCTYYARCLRCEEPGFFLVLELDLYFGEAHEMTKTLHCPIVRCY